jgi:hemoglobin
MNPTEAVTILNEPITHERIHAVVEAFYKKVAVHPELSEPFSTVEDWSFHIEKLTHFWWIRLGGDAYMDVGYNPVKKHFERGMNETNLKAWLNLFHETLLEKLNGAQAQEWGLIAATMGKNLLAKNEMIKRMVADQKKPEN